MPSSASMSAMLSRSYICAPMPMPFIIFCIFLASHFFESIAANGSSMRASLSTTGASPQDSVIFVQMRWANASASVM